jgi:hypothetical protein
MLGFRYGRENNNQEEKEMTLQELTDRIQELLAMQRNIGYNTNRDFEIQNLTKEYMRLCR